MQSMTVPSTLADLLRAARRSLADAGIDTPDLDARLIVEHFSGTTRITAVSSPEHGVAGESVAMIEAALARRAAGEPVHRILGFREFYGLRLALSPDTLEPRPDTETLVDALLPLLLETAARHGECRILDLGTGTGAIALALLAEVRQATATGVDVSEGALATARGNAGALGLANRFSTCLSDWFSNVTGTYHAIAANPPYIQSSDIERLERGVRDFDPRRALDGGADGLEAYRVIAAGAGGHLAEDGVIGVEIGIGQGEQVRRLFSDAGYGISDARIDLAGHERALMFRKKPGNPG